MKDEREPFISRKKYKGEAGRGKSLSRKERAYQGKKKDCKTLKQNSWKKKHSF